MGKIRTVTIHTPMKIISEKLGVEWSGPDYISDTFEAELNGNPYLGEIARDHMTGKTLSPEIRDKIRKKLKGKKLSEETKAKMKLGQQKRRQGPQPKKPPITEEHRLKLSIAAKKQWEKKRVTER